MKVLIAGAAGFFGSNLIRYFLYRSKDLEIIGVDNIPNVEKANLRLYHHKKHKFYVCDINSDEFNTIMELEKPDIVIDTIISQYENDGKNLNTKINLLKTNALTLSLVSEASLIKYSLSDMAKTLKNVYILEVPICFGFRENANKGIAKIIYDAMNDILDGSFGIYSWLFIEELGRVLLRIINDKDFENRKIPGYEFSHMEITNFFFNHFYEADLKIKIKDELEGEEISFKDSIKKTAEWYKANEWSKRIK